MNHEKSRKLKTLTACTQPTRTSHQVFLKVNTMDAMLKPHHALHYKQEATDPWLYKTCLAILWTQSRTMYVSHNISTIQITNSIKSTIQIKTLCLNFYYCLQNVFGIERTTTAMLLSQDVWLSLQGASESTIQIKTLCPVFIIVFVRLQKKQNNQNASTANLFTFPVHNHTC